jgi:hypothetical protein
MASTATQSIEITSSWANGGRSYRQAASATAATHDGARKLAAHRLSLGAREIGSIQRSWKRSFGTVHQATGSSVGTSRDFEITALRRSAASCAGM